jgi:hypothetical protein
MAMGITQALKLQNGSIREIAKLPQQQIMVMAQRQEIPAPMVPIILSEKARMAKEAQQMQAMQQMQAQGQPPSVTEQNMQAIDQAEMQDAMQQEAMRRRMMSGLGSMPMRDDMFRGASGGIVAFEDGGPVDEEEEDTVQVGAQGTDFASIYKRTQGLMKPSDEEKAYSDYLSKQAERTAAQAGQDRAMNLINLGAQIMGGTSPYAFTNIGQGLAAGLPAFQKSAEAQRSAEIAAMKSRAEMARQARLADADVASKVFSTETGLTKAEIATNAKKEIAKYAADNKTTDYRTFVDDYVAAKVEENPKLSVKKLRSDAGRLWREAQLGPQYARIPIQQRGLELDVEGEIRKIQDDKKDLYELAKSPITEKSSPAFIQMVKDAKEEVRALEVQFENMRRSARGEAPKKRAEPAAPAQSSAKKAPSLTEFLERARSANKGVSDKELTDYYNQKYGK